MSICKFYMQNNCKKGINCNFIHDKDICKNWWLNNCNENNCNYNHFVKNNNYSSGKILSNIVVKRKKNTETFKPYHKPMDMKIIMWNSDNNNIYTRKIYSNEVIIINNLFNNICLYDNLLGELNKYKDEEKELFKLWHGDSHIIADDNKLWKEKCPTFIKVVDTIKNYFNMRIEATRLNWYRDSSDWKPFHHDAAAVKKDKAEIQNFTVAISFGEEREVAFEHATSKVKISIPLSNGTIYVFAKDININWRHGILQIPKNKENMGDNNTNYLDYNNDYKGRISIIIWGWVNMLEK